MTTPTLEREPALAPQLSAEEADMALAAQRLLMAALDHSRAASITIHSDDAALPAIDVPPQALRFIAQLLGVMGERRPIVLMPAKQELSTVEAANYLNVSRPFVIKEIDAGRLPHRMVGSHRRIEFADLQAYLQTMRAKQKAAIERMADDAQAQGLEY